VTRVGAIQKVEELREGRELGSGIKSLESWTILLDE
jgi:hypothetical protein